MTGFDATWAMFGLFLLGCGGVPAAMALVAERRRGRETGSLAGVFHENGGGMSLAELERIHRAVAPSVLANRVLPDARGIEA